MNVVKLIPEGWRVVRLGDVSDTPRYGANAPARPFDPDLPRYVRITDITEEGRLRAGDVRSAEPAKVEGYGLYAGDLLFARSGSVGRTYLFRPDDGPCVYAGYLIRFRPDPEIALPRFVDIYTHSLSYYRWVDSVLHVGAQPNINANEFSSLPVLLPPLSEQRAIAEVLDAIDEAIERSEAVIDATERLRSTLLHELLTRGVPGWHSEWHEVPGLGTVPADWEVVRLGDVGSWLSGGTPSKARGDYWSGDLPWVSPKDMKTRAIRDTEDHISKDGAQAGSRVVPEGSIFDVVRGMILDHSFPLAVARVVTAFNQDIRALVCSDGILPEFVLAALEHQKPRLLRLPTPSTHGTMRVRIGGAIRHTGTDPTSAGTTSNRRHIKRRRRSHRAGARGAGSATFAEGVGVGCAVVGARPGAGGVIVSNPNDVIRQQMLQYFYDRAQNATSEKGKKGSHVKISDVKAELKQKYGLSQFQVMAQLTYLISSGWVDKVSEERTFTTRMGTQQPSKMDWYVVTAKGVDRIEGTSSEFMRQNPYSNLNITAVNSAVQLGSGNVVRESFVGLANELERLAHTIAESGLTEEEKMSAIADIETINGQLAKPTPNKNIVRMAWDTISKGKAASLINAGSAITRSVNEIIS